MKINICILNKCISFGPEGVWLPCLTVSIITPIFFIGKAREEFTNEEYKEISTDIPIHFIINKSEIGWYFSVSLVFGLSINYQWDY